MADLGEMDKLLVDAAEGRSPKSERSAAEVRAKLARIEALDRAMVSAQAAPAPSTLTGQIMVAARLYRLNSGSASAVSGWQIGFLLVVCAGLLAGIILGAALFINLGLFSLPESARTLTRVGDLLQIAAKAVSNIGRSVLAQPAVWAIGIATLLLIDTWLGVIGAVLVPGLRRRPD